MCVRSTSLPGQAGRVVLGEETKDKGEGKKKMYPLAVVLNGVA